MTEPTARDVLAEAIAGQNLYYGRHGTTPAGMGAAMAILSALAARGYALSPQPEAAGEAGLRAAAQDLIDYYDGGGFRANFPEDHVDRLRAALGEQS